MTVRDTIFSGNSALWGGAIGQANEGFGPEVEGNLTVLNSTFTNNTADELNGGAIFNTGNLRVANSTFTANSALNGGAIYHDSYHGDLTVLNSTFTDNSAFQVAPEGEFEQGVGGGIYFVTGLGDLVVTGSSFSGNSAAFFGGGIWIYSSHDYTFVTHSTVTNCTFTGNTAGLDGGGILSYWIYGSLTIRDTILTGNSAGNAGGGIINFGELIVQDSQVIENEALLGDDIYNLGSLEIIDSVIGEMFP